MRRPRRSVLSRLPPKPWNASPAPDAKDASIAEAVADATWRWKAASPSCVTRRVMVRPPGSSVASVAVSAVSSACIAITVVAENHRGAVGLAGLVSGAPGSTG